MRFVVIASLASMGLVAVVVGLRLIGLALRTRELPEALLGTGLLLVAVVGGPLAGLGRMPGMIATPFGDGVFALGLGLVQVGIGCWFAFTWQVFRRRSAWTMSAVLLACGALGACWQGLIGASVGGSMQEIYANTRPWAMAIVANVGIAFAWTGFEALRYYRRLLRRQALGLADPEIVNRFWLWGVSGCAVAALSTIMLVPMYLGIPPLSNLLTLNGIALVALVASLCWFFAFFPPRAYLERVRLRAAA